MRAPLITHQNTLLQVHMLFGGKTHTAHTARVRHAWDARLERSRQGSAEWVSERAARSLDRVSRRRGPRRAAGASLEHERDLLDDVRRVENTAAVTMPARWWLVGEVR
jgi:hypothetical protein